MPQASIFTIFLFFIYSYGLGFTITSFLKISENFLERNLMRIGIGLAILPFLGIMLSFFRILIDWKIILALSLIYPVIHLAKNYKSMKFQFKITTYDIFIILMFIIFLFTLFMYAKGAFSYPYFEDDDPWTHAIGIKYVSIEKTVFPSNEVSQSLQYIHPYPPSYDLLLGLLHQTSPSINWTMKFFNALIISLSIIFAFFFVKQFTGSKNKALISVFILAMVPAYLSHFIWAIALAVPLYFVGFYCLEKISEDKKWLYPSIFVIASVLTISPSHSAYFGIFAFLYVLTKTILDRKISFPLLAACAIGVILSFGFWWGIMIKEYGIVNMAQTIGYTPNKGYIGEGGSGDRLYTFNDFFTASSANMINSPIGIGQAAVIFAIISVIIIFLRYKKLLQKENQWLVISLVWLALTIYAVNASRFLIRLTPFRVWPLFAIPLSIIIAEGVNYLLMLAKEIEKLLAIDKLFILRAIIVILFIIGIFMTSGMQKFQLNTMQWGPGGGWITYAENGVPKISSDLPVFALLNKIPLGTKVFSFNNPSGIIGFDKYICAWCSDVRDIQKNHGRKNGQEIYTLMKQSNYEYAIIGQIDYDEYGINQTLDLKQKLEDTKKFIAVANYGNTVIYKIV